jgi:tetratricopeptide (TPR) repeat protein
VNYCSECGFKIDGEFKFCPNCGSNIYSKNTSSDKAENDSAGSLICKNCGEENSIANSDCFSCGIPLSGNKNKIQGRPNQELKKSNRKKSAVEHSSKNNKVIKEEKVIDNKKILIISSAIVVVFIFALVASGVFDSGVQENVSQISNQSTNSSVNLANLEEITQLENKVSADPDDLESTLHLAHLQQDAGLSEKAIVNYNKYLTKFPENADARVDMAICFYNLSDYTTAISEMETAIKYQPKHQIAYLNLGIVNLAAQNLEVSKDWFKKTAELDPNTEAGKRAQELLSSH